MINMVNNYDESALQTYVFASTLVICSFSPGNQQIPVSLIRLVQYTAINGPVLTPSSIHHVQLNPTGLTNGLPQLFRYGLVHFQTLHW